MAEALKRGDLVILAINQRVDPEPAKKRIAEAHNALMAAVSVALATFLAIE